jgi:hypothetical protein
VNADECLKLMLFYQGQLKQCIYTIWASDASLGVLNKDAGNLGVEFNE